MTCGYVSWAVAETRLFHVDSLITWQHKHDFISTVNQQTATPYNQEYNFVNSWWISTILSLQQRTLNFQQNHHSLSSNSIRSVLLKTRFPPGFEQVTDKSATKKSRKQVEDVIDLSRHVEIDLAGFRLFWRLFIVWNRFWARQKQRLYAAVNQ